MGQTYVATNLLDPESHLDPSFHCSLPWGKEAKRQGGAEEQEAKSYYGLKEHAAVDYRSPMRLVGFFPFFLFLLFFFFLDLVSFVHG